MIIADLQERIFQVLRGRGIPHEEAHILASQASSTANLLSEHGPRDGPRAGEYLRVWLKILDQSETPSEAWGGQIKGGD